jgi:hypothetical protein
VSINNEAAYKRSKLSYGGSWRGLLPRGCFPSDIDFLFDNNGRMLFCEMDSDVDAWDNLSGAQLSVYQSAVRHGEHCAALCKHNVVDDRILDNLNDVASFQVMVWHWGSFRVSRIIDGSEQWKRFVCAWYTNPDGLRGNVIEHSAIVKRSFIS